MVSQLIYQVNKGRHLCWSYMTMLLYIFLFLALSVYSVRQKDQEKTHDNFFSSHTVGTFLGRPAAETEADCEPCYPGSYCPLWAQTSVDFLCPPGWFCPLGSVSGHQPGTVHIIRCQLRLNHSSVCTFHDIILFLTQFLIAIK